MRSFIARIAALYGRNGGMEQVEVRMTDVMVQGGHEATIPYRDNQEGDTYFLLVAKLEQRNILFEIGD